MRLLLFHTNLYFIEAFSNLFARKRHDIELFCYSEEDIVKEQLQKERYTAFLCEQGYCREQAAGSFFIELGSTTEMPKESKTGKLNIYQRADSMLEDLRHILLLAEGGKAESSGKERKAAFFSTEGGAGRTTIAYLTAVKAAKSYKTVYWNLCPLADTDNLYQAAFQHTMEDILYAQREKKGVLELLYETLICNKDDVCVLPGIRSLGDYKGLTAECIRELCGYLLQTGTELIILDLPSGYSTFTEELFVFCEKLVWVYGDTERSLRKEIFVKEDPYLRRFIDKSIFVRNRARQKAETGISFPVSHTMQDASQISKVLEVNPDFVSGCAAIEEAIMKG